MQKLKETFWALCEDIKNIWELLLKNPLIQKKKEKLQEDRQFL